MGDEGEEGSKGGVRVNRQAQAREILAKQSGAAVFPAAGMDRDRDARAAAPNCTWSASSNEVASWNRYTTDRRWWMQQGTIDAARIESARYTQLLLDCRHGPVIQPQPPR